MPFELKFESLLDLLRMPPEKFLKLFAPNRLKVLQNAISKIKFRDFKGKFITDLTMPANVGGYYSPDLNIIAINPMLLLHGSEKEIAHVLFHEGIHAGIYTKGTEVLEEVVTETMAKKRIQELYGGPPPRSGYDGLVKEADEMFGDLEYNEMVEQVEDGDEATFDNYLELIIIRPAIGDADYSKLNWKEIRKSLKKKWKLLKKLFPRMINKIAKNNRGLHEDAKMEAYEYKLEGLLERAATKIISENKDIIVDIFLDITKNGEDNLEAKSILKKMVKQGFGYIIDKDPEIVEGYINSLLEQTKKYKFVGAKITKKSFVI
ncbi:MAG: hypothetical protein Kow0081_1250 [Candidatus Dojkabacteria bacterium]